MRRAILLAAAAIASTVAVAISKPSSEPSRTRRAANRTEWSPASPTKNASQCASKGLERSVRAHKSAGVHNRAADGYFSLWFIVRETNCY